MIRKVPVNRGIRRASTYEFDVQALRRQRVAVYHVCGSEYTLKDWRPLPLLLGFTNPLGTTFSRLEYIAADLSLTGYILVTLMIVHSMRNTAHNERL